MGRQSLQGAFDQLIDFRFLVMDVLKIYRLGVNTLRVNNVLVNAFAFLHFSFDIIVCLLIWGNATDILFPILKTLTKVEN